MKQVIKPEPTYGSEILNAKHFSLEEASNDTLTKAIECLVVNLEALDFLKKIYPGHKVALENIIQRMAQLSIDIENLQSTMFKDLNPGKNGEAS